MCVPQTFFPPFELSIVDYFSYRVYQRFGRTFLLWHCGLVLVLSQFLLLLQLPQIMMLTLKSGLKCLENNHVTTLTMVQSKSLIHSVWGTLFKEEGRRERLKNRGLPTWHWFSYFLSLPFLYHLKERNSFNRKESPREKFSYVPASLHCIALKEKNSIRTYLKMEVKFPHLCLTCILSLSLSLSFSLSLSLTHTHIFRLKTLRM